MERPGSKPSKSTGSIEKDNLIQSLIKQGEAYIKASYLTENRPRLPQLSLAYMDTLEAGRELLGPFCTTIGEGEDRTIVFANKRASQKTSLYTEESSSLPGTRLEDSIVTNYEELLTINRNGIFLVVNITDQEFTKDSLDGNPILEQRQELGKQNTRYYGNLYSRLLVEVISTGRYPEAAQNDPENRQKQAIKSAFSPSGQSRILPFPNDPGNDLGSERIITSQHRFHSNPESFVSFDTGLRLVRIGDPATLADFLRPSMSPPPKRHKL